MEAIIKLRKFSLLMALILSLGIRVQAQSAELQQLLLNIEKLTQYKSILSDMKKGYQIYQQGYGMISDVSKGNFNLHNIYLTGLMAVSPAVRNNPRVSQIISQQADLISEYKRYTKVFRQSRSFSHSEMSYIDQVFKQLIGQSNANADDLTNVMTAGKLRMSDDDRLRGIDRIFNSSTDQLQFLRWFNRKAVMLSLQRSKDLDNTQTLKRLYGIN